MKTLAALCVLALLAAPAAAQAFFTESWDAYPTGQLASGTNGWLGWDNVPSAIGDIVAGPARSAPNSIQIDYPDDTIQPFNLNFPMSYPTSGLWRLTVWQYLDGTAFLPGSGDQYVLIQNTYNHNGPYTWALQFVASPDTMTVFDLDRPGGSQPVVLDQWVEVRFDIDLDGGTIATYYNGGLVSCGNYILTASYGGGPTDIACLDLWCTANATSVAYYDDITLQPTGPEYQVNQANASIDVGGALATAFKPAVSSLATNASSALNVSSPLNGNVYDLAVVLDQVHPVSGAGFMLGAQTINLDVAHPTLTFLNSSGPVPLLSPFPGSFSIPFNTGPSAFTVSAQTFIADPSSPDGISFSQASQVDVAPLPCITVEAVGTNSFNSNTTTGFWKVIHRGSCLDVLDVTFDFAGVPTQASMVFDVDQTGMQDRFDGGNSALAGCLGTYRNGSDVATGLVYDAMNTPGCDPAANTGWIGSNPSGTSYKTLMFRFQSGTFFNQTFEFDCDTDGGLGITGASMRDMNVSITLSDTTVLTGTLQPDPSNSNRSFADFL